MVIALNLLPVPSPSGRWNETLIEANLDKLSELESPVYITERGERLYRDSILKAEEIYNNYFERDDERNHTYPRRNLPI